jgi:hypothetical protein
VKERGQGRRGRVRLVAEAGVRGRAEETALKRWQGQSNVRRMARADVQ